MLNLLDYKAEGFLTGWLATSETHDPEEAVKLLAEFLKEELPEHLGKNEIIYLIQDYIKPIKKYYFSEIKEIVYGENYYEYNNEDEDYEEDVD